MITSNWGPGKAHPDYGVEPHATESTACRKCGAPRYRSGMRCLACHPREQHAPAPQQRLEVATELIRDLLDVIYQTNMSKKALADRCRVFLGLPIPPNRGEA